MDRLGVIASIVLIFLWIGRVEAQDPPPCGAPQLALDCQSACVICGDISGTVMTTTTNGFGMLPPGYCTAIQHTAGWIGFIAGTPNLTLQVTVNQCFSGVGIEMGIYEGSDCTGFNLVSNCNTFMPPGVYTFDAAGLTPGCHYWIVFDNNGPAECEFLFTVLSGSTGSPPPVIPGGINGNTVICQPSGLETYSISSVQYACNYNWTVDGGVIVTDPTSNTVNVDWLQPGTHQICVEATNACGTSGQICEQVEVFPEIQPTDEGPYYICDNELYYYEGIPYGAGFHTVVLQSQDGCDSTVFLNIISDPVEFIYMQEDRCAPECVTIGNQTFCESGYYEVTLQQQSFPNCDSVISIDLNILEVDAEILISGQLTCDSDEVTLTGATSTIGGFGDIVYEWTNEAGDYIGNGVTITVNEPGFYTLTITITSLDGQTSCSDFTEVEVIGSSVGPELQFNDQPVICAGESLDLSNLNIEDLNNAGGTITFHSDTPADMGNELNDPVVSPNAETTYYVLSTAGSCTDEIPIVVDVEPSPDIEADGPFSICEGEVFYLDSVTVEELNQSNGMISFHSGLPASPNNQITGATIQPDSTSTYYVISDNGGCIDIDSFDVEIQIVPSANFSIESPICVGDISMVQYMGNVTDSLKFTWTFDGAMGGATDDEGPHMLTWNTPGTKEITLETSLFGCSSNTDTMLVEVEDSIRTPVINCVTTENTVEFSWNDVQGSGDYNVVVISGQTGSFVNDTTYLVGNLVPNEEVIIEIEAIGTNSCGSNYTQISCTAQDCPSLDIQLSGPGSICMDAQATIDIMATIPGSGNGTLQWSGPGITDPTMGVMDIGVAGIGTHTVVLEYSENGCPYTESIDIEVLPVPIAGFSVETPVCSEDEAMITYSGTAGAGANANWNFNGGQASPGNGLTDQMVSWDQEGQYEVTLYIEDQGCISDTASQTITVDRPLDAPVITCETTLTSITFQWDPVIGAGGYQVNVLSGPSGVMQGDSVYFVDGLQAGDMIEIEVIALSDNSCPNSMASVICDAIDCPPIDLEIDPPPSLCFDDNAVPVQLTASGDIQNGTGTWSGQGITDPVSGFFDPNLTGPGTYTITYTYEESVCEYMTTAVVTVNEAPVAEAGDDQVLDCGTNTVTIGSGNSASGPGIEYSWSNGSTTLLTDVSNPGIFILTVRNINTGCVNKDSVEVTVDQTVPMPDEFSIRQLSCSGLNDGLIQILNISGGTPPFEFSINGQPENDATFENLASGDYLIELTDAIGCEWDTVITLNQPEQVMVDLGPDELVIYGDPITINAQIANSWDSIMWSPESILTCDGCLQQQFTPEESVTVIATVVNEFGCRDMDTMLIRVKREYDFYVPNVFSPNNDGFNDNFTIFTGEDVDVIEEIYIYTRWGEPVFEAKNIPPNDPTLGWDGNYQGEPVNPAVYVYQAIIRFENGVPFTLKGDVTLVR